MANLRIKIVLTLADHDGPEKGQHSQVYKYYIAAVC